MLEPSSRLRCAPYNEFWGLYIALNEEDWTKHIQKYVFPPEDKCERSKKYIQSTRSLALSFLYFVQSRRFFRHNFSPSSFQGQTAIAKNKYDVSQRRSFILMKPTGHCYTYSIFINKITVLVT